MDTDDRTDLETRMAYLERTVEDLSDVIARQDRELSELKTKLQLVIERLPRDTPEGGVFIGDERPPHW